MPQDLNLTERVKAFIKRHNLFSDGDAVVIGLSGGLDSSVLLHMLNVLNRENRINLRLIPAHLNHCLRGKAADDDHKFCRSAASSYGLKLVSSAVSVSGQRQKNESLEQAGRRLRYEFFRATAEKHGAQKIAVAHHAGDLSESVILRLQRGCGLYGLAAMQPKRPLNRNEKLSLVRPLLCAGKKDLYDYSAANDLDYRTDATNSDPAFMRNHVRINLIPELKKTYDSGSLDRCLAEMCAAACEIKSRVEKIAGEHWESIVREKDAESISLDTDGLLKLYGAVRISVFRRALQHLCGATAAAPGLSRKHWQNLDAALTYQPGYSVSLPGDIMARKEHGCIYFFSGPGKKYAARALLDVPGSATPPGQYEAIKARLITVKQGESARYVSPGERLNCHLDAAELKLPLEIRTRRTGDVFHPLGAAGSRRLKRFFIDRKIPLHRRELIPLVLDASGRIVWVVGEEIADFCKLSRKTEKIVGLSAHPGKDA